MTAKQLRPALVGRTIADIELWDGKAPYHGKFVGISGLTLDTGQRLDIDHPRHAPEYISCFLETDEYRARRQALAIAMTDSTFISAYFSAVGKKRVAVLDNWIAEHPEFRQP